MKNAQQECTGICRIVTCLAKNTRSLGYETSVLFLGEGPLEAEMNEAGIPASVVPWDGSRSDFGGALSVWSWLRKNPAEIVHSHYGGLTVRATCRLAGTRAVVQHVHSRILENKGGALVSDLSFRAADAVIASSQAVADCLRGCHAEVIYAGLNTESEPPAAAATNGIFKLGVLTRLVRLKNVESVIEATARLANKGIEVQAEIAGSGPSEPALRALASSLAVAGRVRFLGWSAGVRSLLASWNLVVIPSMEESFPLAALEAMVAARPVVASQVGGLGELVVDGVTGRLIPPGNTDALVRCIEELANDRQRSIHMGLEGWKRAQRHFSADIMARRTAEVYDRVLRIKAHGAA